jgi:cyclomaltodextrinase
MSFEVFDSRSPDYKSVLSPVHAGESLRFSIILGYGENCYQAFLCVWPDGGEKQLIQMEFDGHPCDGFNRYSVVFTPQTAGLYFYTFEFEGNWRRNYITAFEGGKGRISPDGGAFQLTVCERDFVTPDWAKHGVMYQIFPDRFFASGSIKKNVPSDRFICDDWSARPAFRQNDGPRSLNNDYYGGDLRGIMQKLPYLRSLGVTIIYLNPIFEAHSNHRYNTADYFHVDPLLGTDSDFSELCAEAKRQGVRVILDGVFSHTGDDSRYFNRYGRYDTVGAYQSRQSPYFGWFNFKNWPDEYDSWWGVPSLPETDEDNADFTDFICGENGVLRHWMRMGASGWRLDVADELPDAFLDNVRSAIKAEDPDALLIGEVWEDASNKISHGGRRRFLQGRQLDSVMNYPFRSAIIDFLSGGNSRDLENAVLKIVENYPKPSVDTLMNLLGTHDTERILSVLSGAGLDGSREWQAEQRLTPEQREKGLSFLRLAAVLQYTLPGIPCVYYGDEAGTEGLRDPFNRCGFPWDEADRELTGFYQKIGKIRNDNAAFDGGDFIPYFSEFGHIAYIRKKGENEVLCAVNRWCDPVCIRLTAEWQTASAALGNPPENDTLTVPAMGAAILVKNNL